MHTISGRHLPGLVGGTGPARYRIFGYDIDGAAWRALDLLLTWQERARQRHVLAGLEDRMLEDIGIGRAEAVAEAGKAFWRA